MGGELVVLTVQFISAMN